MVISGSSKIKDGAILESLIANLLYGNIPVFLNADVKFSGEKAFR